MCRAHGLIIPTIEGLAPGKRALKPGNLGACLATRTDPK